LGSRLRGTAALQVRIAFGGRPVPRRRAGRRKLCLVGTNAYLDCRGLYWVYGCERPQPSRSGSRLEGVRSRQGRLDTPSSVSEAFGSTATVTVWPILRGIGGLPVIRTRTGNRWGSRTQSTVWLTAASRPVDVPLEPSCTKMPPATPKLRRLRARSRARRPPDSARLRRGQSSVFFTSRPGALKPSDGGLVLEISDIWASNYPNKIVAVKSASFKVRKPSK
jgi:hypothetical protein